MDMAVVVVIVVGVALVALLAIIVAPSRSVRAERPLPDDVEARVLMGGSPREIAAEFEDRNEFDAHAPEVTPPTAS
jgi:hypothetical protein